MSNLVDIDQYSELLSDITKIDSAQVKRVVVLYLSSVSVGIISFDKACEAIEDELTREMKKKKKDLEQKRRLMLTPIN